MNRGEERAKRQLQRAAIQRFGARYLDWHPQQQPKPKPQPTRKEKEFTQTPEWKALRAKVLKANGWKCAHCGVGRRGWHKLHVDHIKPRSLYPELALEESNLQVLCERCNQAKSNYDRWQEMRELRAIPEVFRYPPR